MIFIRLHISWIYVSSEVLSLNLVVFYWICSKTYWMLYTQFSWSKILKIRPQDLGNLRYHAVLQKTKKIENLKLVLQILWEEVRAWVMAFFTLLTYFEWKSYTNLIFIIEIMLLLKTYLVITMLVRYLLADILCSCAIKI